MYRILENASIMFWALILTAAVFWLKDYNERNSDPEQNNKCKVTCLE
tara:strand:- start:1367 stop:1507 length:141 start_codon:yes stop_codon:yes gene_type:complete